MLDFDNKVKGDTASGLDLVGEPYTDQYDALKQVTLRWLTLNNLCRYKFAGGAHPNTDMHYI